jgi:hypothetical protein
MQEFAGNNMKSAFKTGLAIVAVCGAVLANPAFGAGAGAGAARSAQALPLLAAAVGSVPYTAGLENNWSCVKVADEALKIDGYVQVDAAGRVVVDPKGASFPCRAPGASPDASAGGGGFPVEILAGVAGLAGGAVALAGGGDDDDNDSPG